MRTTSLKFDAQRARTLQTHRRLTLICKVATALAVAETLFCIVLDQFCFSQHFFGTLSLTVNTFLLDGVWRFGVDCVEQRVVVGNTILLFKALLCTTVAAAYHRRRAAASAAVTAATAATAATYAQTLKRWAALATDWLLLVALPAYMLRHSVELGVLAAGGVACVYAVRTMRAQAQQTSIVGGGGGGVGVDGNSTGVNATAAPSLLRVSLSRWPIGASMSLLIAATLLLSYTLYLSERKHDDNSGNTDGSGDGFQSFSTCLYFVLVTATSKLYSCSFVLLCVYICVFVCVCACLCACVFFQRSCLSPQRVSVC
jgi:hypothetical protein